MTAPPVNPAEHDLHGSAPDRHDSALLLVDVVNPLDFPEADQLLPHFERIAAPVRELKRRAKAARVPVIYANDNFGRWRSDLTAVVEHCRREGCKGCGVVEQLLPDADDYFVLKPKHSAFFSTTLDILLRYLGTKILIICGVAGNICVLFTANDAYLRDLKVVVPGDCCASNTEQDNAEALAQMAKVLKADTRPGAEVEFGESA